MALAHRVSGFWISGLFAAGALLAVALLAQTIVTYQYVSSNVIRQQARRAGEERVRNVERSARLSRPQDVAALQAILDDLRADTSDQVVALSLLQGDGTLVATSGQPGPRLGPDDRRRFLRDRDAPFTGDWHDGREVLVGVFPCRCALPRDLPAGGEAAGTGRLLLEVALYRDSLSAPFARLIRNSAISASAALALLVSVSLIAVRFRPYVRGKQLEAQADLARQVQRDLLPGPEAWPASLDVAADCLPASQVGGDFYDVVRLPGGRVAFALGDVSGHGISAALLMGLIHGAMNSPPWGVSQEDPHDAAAGLNDLLLTKSSGERFASLFWCSYDPASRTLRYINAGHLPPLWIRAQPGGPVRVDRLAEGGPLLGVLSTAAYRTVPIEAQAGDVLVLFSDGIVEAMNSRGEPFGEERLIVTASAHQEQPARAICDEILAAVRAFLGNAPAQDDQTLLVVRLW